MTQILRSLKNTSRVRSIMDEYHSTVDFLESNSYTKLTASEKVFIYEKLSTDRPECKAEPEDENERSQGNGSQTSTPSCVSKMDYTLPRYRNNVSPAIDKLMRMMNMPSLITSQDSSSDLSPPANRLSPPDYCRSDNEILAVSTPIAAREHLDICFSSPKPFVSTYKRDSAENQSRTKENDPLLSQIERESVSGWSEIVELPDDEPVVESPRYEVKETPPYITIERESR